jgi:alpha-ketoglutarate-dependent taurine dioxygenase
VNARWPVGAPDLSRDCLLAPLEPFGVSLTAKPTRAGDGAELAELPVSYLRSLTQRHAVVLLRGFAPMTSEEMTGYAATWGPLLAWNFGVVLNLVVHDDPRNYLFTHGNVPFHWDGAFAEKVPSFQLFQCVKAPAAGSGGETLFAHTPSAWRRATADQQKRWSEVTITYTTEKVAHYGGVTTHPLVAKHPHTGERTLRFAEKLNDESVKLNPLELEIAGLPRTAQEGFLSELRSALYDEQVCYRHAWSDGDYLLADNHALLHGRNAFRAGSPRHLQRIHII